MRVLFVMSGVDYLTGKDGKRHATGYWIEEFVVPYRELKKAGVRVTVATPKGVVPAPDPRSFEHSNWKSEKELEAARRVVETAPELKRPASLESLMDRDLSRFAAVFYPGGHAPMEDLATNPDSGRILKYFHASHKPTALVCHGPIALLSARQGDNWPYAGYNMTVFSDSEEKQSHLASQLTYSVQEQLTKGGGIYIGAKDWTPNVVEDRELITGQNPMSSQALAQALINRLKGSAR